MSIFKELCFVIGAGISMRIENWSKRNRKLSNILSYIFFPIFITMELIGWEINKTVCFRSINDGKKTNNEHLIYSMCYHYMKFLSRIHKWKRLFSRTWFYNILEKHKLMLYNYSIDNKNKTDYNAFKSYLGIYGEEYVFMGSAKLNTEGSTIISIK